MSDGVQAWWDGHGVAVRIMMYSETGSRTGVAWKRVDEGCHLHPLKTKLCKSLLNHKSHSSPPASASNIYHRQSRKSHRLPCARKQGLFPDACATRRPANGPCRRFATARVTMRDIGTRAAVRCRACGRCRRPGLPYVLFGRLAAFIGGDVGMHLFACRFQVSRLFNTASLRGSR